MNFKEFLFESERQFSDDLKRTLDKIPSKHRNLVKDYKFVFQSGNSLKNDPHSIGEVDEEKKRITVAAPWNYPREYTVLHEVGHLVWKFFVDQDRRRTWGEIVKRTKEKQDQNEEELFCMAYANTYAHHEIMIHTHPEWERFVRSVPH